MAPGSAAARRPLPTGQASRGVFGPRGVHRAAFFATRSMPDPIRPISRAGHRERSTPGSPRPFAVMTKGKAMLEMPFGAAIAPAVERRVRRRNVPGELPCLPGRWERGPDHNGPGAPAVMGCPRPNWCRFCRFGGCGPALARRAGLAAFPSAARGRMVTASGRHPACCRSSRRSQAGDRQIRPARAGRCAGQAWQRCRPLDRWCAAPDISIRRPGPRGHPSSDPSHRPSVRQGRRQSVRGAASRRVSSELPAPSIRLRSGSLADAARNAAQTTLGEARAQRRRVTGRAGRERPPTSRSRRGQEPCRSARPGSDAGQEISKDRVDVGKPYHCGLRSTPRSQTRKGRPKSGDPSET